MNAIIVEDEVLAIKNLKSILSETAPEVHIVKTFDSVRSTVRYLTTAEMPDLIFMDIQLADGTSFSIFKQVEINCPVIFITAYDSFALEAFKVNSIDYILKPIDPMDVARAFKKLKALTGTDQSTQNAHLKSFIDTQHQYSRTFLVPMRDRLIPVHTNQIAFFYTSNERVLVFTVENKQYTMDLSLETISSKLDPETFFRANRQFIIAHSQIEEVAIWFGNKLLVKLKTPTPERIVISKARAADFKKWLVKN